MTLTILGLGPGHIDDLSRRAWRTLEDASLVYLRTTQHPCVPELPKGPEYRSFDDLYEATADFNQVYATIVERVLEAAKAGDVVYAVPGDPLVAEATVIGLMKAARNLPTAGEMPLEIVNGISFVEPILKLLGVDALDGLQLLDGIDLARMHHPPINPDYPALLGQVYSRQVASDVKLTLMNQYPDDFQVTLVHAAGTSSARIEAVPLYEIDRSEHIAHLTALYIPALGNKSSFEEFQEIIAHLRDPETGCPWDKKQTHLSLRQYLLEEAHEVLEAIDAGDSAALSEELGDLLLQVVLHTQIAIDDGEFRMADVLSHINNKLIFRHPHIWGSAGDAPVSVSGAEQVVANWEVLKKQERAEQGKEHRQSLLDGVSKGLPALLQSYQYQSKVAKPGFDWASADDVVAKVREEIDEVLTAESETHRAEEMGDLLFAIVNWSRWLGIEPESALRQANTKFYHRFRHVEERAAQNDKPLAEHTPEEMNVFWDEAKANGL